MLFSSVSSASKSPGDPGTGRDRQATIPAVTLIKTVGPAPRAVPRRHATRLHHPQVGDLTLRREKLIIGGAKGQLLVIYGCE